MKPTAALISIAAATTLALVGACSKTEESTQEEGGGDEAAKGDGQSQNGQSEEPVAREEQVAKKTVAGAAIAFEATTHNFGKVTVGDVKTVSFSFTNTGDQPLLVKEVKTSCGCTTTGQYNREVLPGKTGIIPLKLSTSRFDGPLRKDVTVVSNAVDHPVTRLHLEADVWVPVKVEPRYAAFGILANRNVKQTKVVKIRNMEAEPLTLTDFSATGDNFEAKLVTVTEGKEYEIIFTTLPPMLSGLNRGEVTLKTSKSLIPEIKIAVHGTVESPVMVSPSRIILPAGKLPTPLTRVVNVRGKAGKTLVVSDAVADLDGIAIDVKSLRAGEQYQLIATFPKGFEVPGEGAFFIRASTNHPEVASIQIPMASALSQASKIAALPVPDEGESDPGIDVAAQVPTQPEAQPKPESLTPPPDIHFERIVHDFGAVSAGGTLPAEFVFTNQGKGLLKVSGVKLSCGCITAGEWDREVAPGAQGKIPFLLDPSKFGGLLSKTITVLSNDPVQPMSTLTVKAQISNPIQATPRFAAFGVINDTAQTAKRTIRIMSNEEKPLKLSEPKVDSDAFKAVLTTVRPGKEFHLIVETSSALVVGTNRGKVTIETSSASIPTLTFQAHATLIEPLTVTPKSIILPQEKPAAILTRYVMLRNNLPDGIAVSLDDNQPDGVLVDLQEIRPGKQYRLEVKFPAGFGVPAVGAPAIKLKTDHPDHATLSIPIVTANGAKRLGAGANP